MNRRDALRTITTGAALAVATTPVAAAVPVPISADLMRLIEAHRTAEAELERICVIADDMLFASGSTLTDAEEAAFTAVLSHPPRDLDELRAMVRHGQDMCWYCCRVNEHDFEALVGAILAGGR